MIKIKIFLYVVLTYSFFFLSQTLYAIIKTKEDKDFNQVKTFIDNENSIRLEMITTANVDGLNAFQQKIQKGLDDSDELNALCANVNLQQYLRYYWEGNLACYAQKSSSSSYYILNSNSLDMKKYTDSYFNIIIQSIKRMEDEFKKIEKPLQTKEEIIRFLVYDLSETDPKEKMVAKGIVSLQEEKVSNGNFEYFSRGKVDQNSKKSLDKKIGDSYYSLAILIDPNSSNNKKKIGQRAAKSLINLIIKYFDIDQLIWNCHPKNFGSNAIAKKCGFTDRVETKEDVNFTLELLNTKEGNSSVKISSSSETPVSNSSSNSGSSSSSSSSSSTSSSLHSPLTSSTSIPHH